MRYLGKDNDCKYWLPQLDRNGDICCEFCNHPENPMTVEGNCRMTICPMRYKYKEEKEMGNPTKSRSIIVRNRNKVDKQIQIVVDYESRTIGVVHNKGMEVIFIDSILSKDVSVTYADIKDVNPFNAPFDPAKTRVGSIQDCTFSTDKI